MREQVPSKLEFRQKTDRVHQFTSFVDLQRHFIQSHTQARSKHKMTGGAERVAQIKNTISFIYTILDCTEEQQYIILLWSTILWNFSFLWQLSILVEKFHFCSRI